MCREISGTRMQSLRRGLMGAVLALAVAHPMASLGATNPSAHPAANGVPASGIDGEACPARVDGMKLHAGGIVAFDLAARRSRLLSASMEMQTDAGWFTFNIPATQLLVSAEHWHTNNVDWTANRIASAPLYVQLPAGSAKVRYLWLTRAHVLTPSDPWYSAGPVTCAPYANAIARTPVVAEVSIGKTSDIDRMILLNPDRSLDAAVPRGAPILAAESTPAMTYSCAHPFENATATHLPAPVYPEFAPIVHTVSAIAITVLPSGAVGATRVFRPTGNSAFDKAALDEVAGSTFAPAVAFCEPAWGRYLFEINFQGHA